jgi:integrase
MREGKRVRRSLETRDRDVAIGLVRELRAAVARQQEGERFAVAVEEYVQEKMGEGRLSRHYGGSRKTVLLAFGRAAGVSDAREVTPAMVRRFVDEARQRRGNAMTGNHYLRHLRQFFRWCQERGLILMDPTREVRPVMARQQARESWVPVEMVRGILDDPVIDEDMRLVLLLGFEAGFRRSEILGATARWLDLERGLIRIPPVGEGWKRKNNREAVVPLAPRLRAWFATHAPQEPFLVAPWALPGRWRYRWEFRKRFSEIMRRHGLPDVTIHDMRRSFASNRVSAGVPVERVASWLGISIATAWQHYARFMPVTGEIDRGSA